MKLKKEEQHEELQEKSNLSLTRKDTIMKHTSMAEVNSCSADLAQPDICLENLQQWIMSVGCSPWLLHSCDMLGLRD